VVQLVAAGAVIVLGATGCGSSSAASSGPAAAPVVTGSVQVRVGSVPGLGQVLVDGSGDTLYMFPPDKQQAVTCTGVCAGSWPPLSLPPGQHPVAGPGVRAALLSGVADPEGGQVVTYAGWPLYTYIDDVTPGQASGQALNLNGGYWYVLRPSGQIVTTPVAGAAG
jgi:predicted lipoprotein with Yx(FWY)xxD motif